MCVNLCLLASSDVVWECKLQKKNRWKTLSMKDADLLEQSYKEYMETNPVDHSILTLPNNFQVRGHALPNHTTP